MDIVVYLALAVLAAVFLFSLFILIVMCHRRYEYNRLLMVHSLRFSKLRHDNLDDIIQLGPHISQILSSNQWVEGVSGILQHCVSVLKLCHSLTDKMSKIQLNQISPQLNEAICQATLRVVPRFDILLRSLAAKNVDIRVIESRMAALVSACWALATPFYLINPKYQENLGSIIQEMEGFHSHLQIALEQLEGEYPIIQSPPSPNPSSSEVNLSKSPVIDSDSVKKDDDVISDQSSDQTLVNPSPSPKNISPNKSAASIESNPTSPLISKTRKPMEESPVSNGSISLKCKSDDPTTDLLNDEAPADPACF